tara:strand:+ start:273 stop:596 length:324 start_codon:yes stop_codon:yes gene_type:complete
LILLVRKVKPEERSILKELRKRKGEVAITLKEKRKRDYMDGLAVGVVKVNPKVGFLVPHVVKRMVQNLAEERMPLKEEREGVDLLVPLVKHIKGGKENELGFYFKSG